MNSGPPDRPSEWDAPLSSAFDRLRGPDLVAQLPSPIPRPALDRAVARLQLDDTRRTRIQSALKVLEERLRNDPAIAKTIRRFSVQGSFGLRTAIKPTGTGSFDVDVLVVLDVRKLPLLEISPRGTIGLVESALRATSWYSKRLEIKARCIRIEYDDGFHVDVVPAHCDTPYSGSSGPVLIPNRAMEGWEETHPLGYKAWFDRIDSRTSGRLRQMVVLMKRWRDETDGVEVPSMLLTTLLGYAETTSALSLSRSLASTLARLDELLATHPEVPFVQNPSLPKENLARDWDQLSYERFKVALAVAAARAQAAIRPGAQPTVRWKELFGSVIQA